MKYEDDNRPVSDAPTYDDHWWFSVAVAAFILAAVAFSFAALWTFSVKGQDAVFRAQAFSPFGIALGAVVTFCTVVWRGILSLKQIRIQSEQLQNQTEQLKQIVRQNDAKEDETLVKLLQEGAKFITEAEKEAQVMAGITSLHSLLENDRARKFSAQALDIIAEFYVANYDKQTTATRRARAVLNSAAAVGLQSGVRAEFKTTKRMHVWPPIGGFSNQHYEGGDIYEMTYQAIISETMLFTKVTFHRVQISDNAAYFHCSFQSCKIAAFDPTLLDCKFANCDFSGCEFTEPSEAYDFEQFGRNFRNCFFYNDNPPSFPESLQWEKYFEAK